MFNTSLITPSRLLNHTEVEDRFPCYGVNFFKLFFLGGCCQIIRSLFLCLFSVTFCHMPVQERFCVNMLENDI